MHVMCWFFFFQGMKNCLSKYSSALMTSGEDKILESRTFRYADISTEITTYRNVRLPKFLHTEMSAYRNVRQLELATVLMLQNVNKRQYFF